VTRRREPSLHELVHATPLRPPGPHDAVLERFLANADSIPPPATGARVITESGHDYSFEAALAQQGEAVKRLAQAELRRSLEEQEAERRGLVERAEEAEAKLAAKEAKEQREAEERRRGRLKTLRDVALLIGGAGLTKFLDHFWK
jgi:hypothetical protein